MASLDNVQSLLAEVATRLETELPLEEDGSCVVEYAEGRTLVIEFDVDSEAVLVYAPAFAVPADNREAFFERVLELNLLGQSTGGCTLGLDPDAELIVLSAAESLQGLDADGCVNLLGGFVETLSNLQAMLEQDDSLEDDLPPSASDGAHLRV